MRHNKFINYPFFSSDFRYDKILLVCFIIFHTSLCSQDIDYARNIIDTLTSKNYGGRGALGGGEKKAADYIANEFNKHGLNHFNKTFFQAFSYPRNVFPGELNVSFDGTPLIAGKDYLVGAASGKISGTFQLIWYDKENTPSKKQLKKLSKRNFFDDKFIIIDDSEVEKDNELFQLLKSNVFGAAGIILIENKKLTQSLSSTSNDYGILKVKREKINNNYNTITLTINQVLIHDYQSQNVIGYVEGTEHPDSFIIISAHYDHLGKMGNDVYFPGANDNASGVAMLLSFSHYYAHNPPTKTIIFIAFGAEEAGILGSNYFVEHPLVSLSNINFVMNMDIMGTGGEGAMIVNGSILPKQFELLQKINNAHNYLVAIKKRGEAANSDHYWFTKKGIPAFFIYTLGGIKAYHDVYDIAETLPLTEFEDCFRLIRDFIAEL